MEKGMSLSGACRAAAAENGCKRSELYKLLLKESEK
jgi:hypothetical protein